MFWDIDIGNMETYFDELYDAKDPNKITLQSGIKTDVVDTAVRAGEWNLKPFKLRVKVDSSNHAIVGAKKYDVLVNQSTFKSKISIEDGSVTAITKRRDNSLVMRILEKNDDGSKSVGKQCTSATSVR